MPAQPLPRLSEFHVWSCVDCWDDTDGLNHRYDYEPMEGLGWVEVVPEARCYCCGRDRMLRAVRVRRYLDPNSVHGLMIAP